MPSGEMLASVGMLGLRFGPKWVLGAPRRPLKHIFEILNKEPFSDHIYKHDLYNLICSIRLKNCEILFRSYDFNLKKIEEKSAKERLVIFQRLADEVKTKYRKKLVNTITRVLFENNTRGNNKYFGRDEYFNSVIVNSNENLIGKIRSVKINSCNQNTLFGEVNLEDTKKVYAA